MKKKCSKCKLEKEFNDFYIRKNRRSGINSWCKECCLEAMYNRYIKNSEEILRKNRIRSKHRRDKTNAYKRVYVAEKMRTDIQFRLRQLLRDRLRKAIKHDTKVGSAVRDLGCTIEDFKIYLESMFLPGMTWENHGHGEDKWNIDHIKSLCTFDLTDREQLLEACNYTNMQPLWQPDNFRKGRE